MEQGILGDGFDVYPIELCRLIEMEVAYAVVSADWIAPISRELWARDFRGAHAPGLAKWWARKRAELAR